MISFDNVSVVKEGRVILRDLTLDLDKKRIGIIGHNGSGKSTFIRLINGIEQPAGGTVKIDGLSTKEDRKNVLKKVGFVFQNPDNQIIYPIVREDIAFGLKNRRLSKHEISERIEKMAKNLGLDHLLDRFTHTLSGGEKQMLALFGVLILEPEIILLDEPTTLLDLGNKSKIMSFLKTLPQQVIVISHDLEFLLEFDEVLCFEGGRLKSRGLPKDIIDEYKASQLC
ncbi:MAG: ABC transporter ATP-binding protein [Alphaproteobacteria bacterium]|nr:ABC transporter ATP-binding protein [Alphaproteobacteria bacterium]